MNRPEDSALGRAAVYPRQYDPGLLYPLPRAPKRAELGLDDRLPFFGADQWTAFELSWLNPRGKPQVALAHVLVPCESPCIVESKSFKLYLNSFNHAVFAHADAVQRCLQEDLNRAIWQDGPVRSAVVVRLLLPAQWDTLRVQELEGLSLDRLDVACTRYTPAPDLLQVRADEPAVSQVLCSQLLKSNCLVTGQPDWGSVQIAYTGHPIDEEGLLQYLVSYRDHDEFHEQCVERIFMDLWRRCRPSRLAVHARYTRRGGLDISPFRTSFPQSLPEPIRTARQ